MSHRTTPLLFAIMMFAVSSYLGLLTFLFLDYSMKKTLATTASSLFVGGTVLTVGWLLLSLPSFYARLRKRGD